jgi:hypothetical protein
MLAVDDEDDGDDDGIVFRSDDIAVAPVWSPSGFDDALASLLLAALDWSNAAIVSCFAFSPS